eukprot:scaffold14015_cov48-Phaeocystis_antarctica.AAC.2
MPLTHRSRPPPCRLSPHLPPPCMTSLTTRQNAKKFNTPLNFDTSSGACALNPTSSRAASLRAASSTTAPTALSPPGQYPELSLATRQGAPKFNKPLNFDTSSVTSMEAMFKVRALNPTSSRAASLRAASSTTAPTALSRLPASIPSRFV